MDILNERELWWVTGVVVFLGLFWLAIEFALRGGAGKFALVWSWICVLGGGVAFAGLGIRPRVSLVGETKISLELLRVVLFSMFVLPFLMFVFYLMLSITSVGIAGLSWLLWVLLVLLAVVVQLVIWVATLVGVLIDIKAPNESVSKHGLISAIFGFVAVSFIVGVIFFSVGALVVILIAIGIPAESKSKDKFLSFLLGFMVVSFIVGVIAFLAGIKFENAWNFRIVGVAFANNNWVPTWDFLLSMFRKSIVGFKHNRAVSLVFSVCTGLSLGWIAALLMRWLRHRLMGWMEFRIYLPLASAPLPDQSPFLDRPMAFSAVLYLSCFWAVVICLVLL